MINMFKNDQHDTLVPSLLSHWGQGERLAPKSPRERVPVVLPEPVQAGSMRAARPVSEPCLPPPRTRFGQVTRHDCDASELQPRRSARGFDPNRCSGHRRDDRFCMFLSLADSNYCNIDSVTLMHFSQGRN